VLSGNDIDTCVLLLLAYLFLFVCVCVTCFCFLDEVRVNIPALCAVYISSQKTKDTLDKTEGAMKNGQTRYTGNMRNTRHRTKTNMLLFVYDACLAEMI
jgi:hypothetical protein